MEQMKPSTNKFSVIEEKLSQLSNIKSKLLEEPFIAKLQQRLIQLDKNISSEQIKNQRQFFQNKLTLKKCKILATEMQETSSSSLKLRQSKIQRIKEEILRHSKESIQYEMPIYIEKKQTELQRKILEEKQNRKIEVNTFQDRIKRLLSTFQQKQIQLLKMSQYLLQNQQISIRQLCGQLITDIDQHFDGFLIKQNKIKDQLYQLVRQIKGYLTAEEVQRVKNKEAILNMINHAYQIIQNKT